MGQHTWFDKDVDLYKEQESLYKKIDDHNEYITYLHDYEILEIEQRIDEIDEMNSTDYHDLFRTNKRESDGQYTLDVIYSEKECYEWLENNKEYVYYINHGALKEFWDKHTNGVIHFG